MKSKKLISTILALLLALQCITPAFASEGDIPPEAGETAEETLPPEDPEEVLPETPPEDPVPQEPEETQPPEDAQEPGEAQGPEDAQPPDAVQDQPEDGSDPEDIPDAAEDPLDPDAAEDPVDPDAVPLEDLIDVLVPSSGQMILNPYRLPVDLEGGETTDQIVHSCQTLINQSDFPVTVNVTVTGTVPAESGAAFVSEPPSPDAPDKEVFLYAEFQPDPDWWEGSYYDLSNQLLVSEEGTEREDVLTLDAQGEGYFRLFGEMSEAPEEPWSKTDTFGAVLTFTFTPVYAEPAQAGEPEVPEELPEEEPPEESEDPDAPEDVLPEEPVTPEIPEEVPRRSPELPRPRRRPPQKSLRKPSLRRKLLPRDRRIPKLRKRRSRKDPRARTFRRSRKLRPDPARPFPPYKITYNAHSKRPADSAGLLPYMFLLCCFPITTEERESLLKFQAEGLKPTETARRPGSPLICSCFLETACPLLH